MTGRVLLLGAGGHAKVLLDLLRATGVTIVAVVDSNPARWRQKILDIEVAGGDDVVLAHPVSECELVNGVGSVSRDTLVIRRDLYLRFNALGYRFAQARHPAAVISTYAVLEEGIQVMAGAVIQACARIGVNAIINTSASVDHDCVIGAHSHIAPGATLSGGVVIGKEVHVGTGAILKQGVKVGDGAVIGAGSVVLHDVPPGSIVFGSPATESRA